jgi:Ca-activated chloride channel family protein
MKKTTIGLALALCLLAASPSLGAGLMTPTDSTTPLQIKNHDVRVVINNGFAITEVDQVFYNPGDEDLEAIYTFPLPKDASLSELSLWIDGQEIIGEVVEKERARKIYREERDSGNDAALAEQREYYAFDVFVSPVRAASETRVRLLYMQPLQIDLGVGRYVYPLEEGGIDEQQRAFWDVSPVVTGTFAFDCSIKSAYPLEDVRTTAADDVSTVSQYSPGFWNVHINADEGAGTLDKDIVVYYRLDQNLPARVDLLAHRTTEEDGTFLVVITPGVDLQKTVGGVDWTVVLDVSGSMQSKIRAATRAVSDAIGQMGRQDRFRLIDFADDARFLIEEPTLITPTSIDRAKWTLGNLGTRGGTNVYAGIELALKNMDSSRPNAIILVSDGGANVGPTHHRAFLDLLEETDVRVFTFVWGQGANRPLLERLARDSGGFAMDVSNRDDLYGRLVQAKAKLAREAMHGVKLELDGVEATELTPARLPNAYYGQQIVTFGRYERPGRAQLRLEARISGEERSWETAIDLPDFDTTYPELERLWALATVRDLQERIEDGGEKRNLRNAIVDLGTEYGIVTNYTSMLVVRPERFEELGIERNNERRVQNERAARSTRSQSQPRSTRVDRQQPMYPNQPSPGLGGGAVGPWFLAALAVLLGGRAIVRRRTRK